MPVLSSYSIHQNIKPQSERTTIRKKTKFVYNNFFILLLSYAVTCAVTFKTMKLLLVGFRAMNYKQLL